MKNLFKKYGLVLAVFAFAFSISISSAQITGGNVNVQCVRYNPDGSCAQTAVSGGIVTGSGQQQQQGQQGTPTCPAGKVLVMVNNQPMCQAQPGGTAAPGSMGGVYQGQNTTRQQNAADLSFFYGILGSAGGLIRMLPPILIGIAVVVFFVFLIRYFMASSADDKGKNLKRMGYSLAAIFIMVALWGIIAFFGDLIGINPNVQVTAPRLPQ